MAIIKEAVIPLGRPLFIPKEGNLSKEDLIIESSGDYLLMERPDHFIVKNDECCRSIQVIIKTAD
ncbi:MAG: hypothetical protein GX119_00040 [Syntrophomonadaceae bacterium]|jgi:hypothetical protein|nr:hypothetical protein [Syntrophomonadaceae bacterium]